MKETSDGYIVVGNSESFGDNLIDGYIVKVDFDGELIWEKTYGGASDDYVESIEQYPDGYIVWPPSPRTEDYPG